MQRGCVICGHRLRDHYQEGCHRESALRGACSCAFVDLPPLPPTAAAEDHRRRSDWWDELAHTSQSLARAARFDLGRWYPLARFERNARQAELDHRLRALEIEGPQSNTQLASVAAPTLAAVPIDSVEDTSSVLEPEMDPAVRAGDAARAG